MNQGDSMTDTASVIAGNLPDGRPVLIAAKWVESDGQRIQQLYLNYKEDEGASASGESWVGWVPLGYVDGTGSPAPYFYSAELGTIASGAPGVPTNIFILDPEEGKVWAGTASEDENADPEYGPSGISWWGWGDFYSQSGSTESGTVFPAAASVAAMLNGGTLQLYIGGNTEDPRWQMVVATPSDPEPFDAVPFLPQPCSDGQVQAPLGRLIAATRPDGHIQIWGIGGYLYEVWTSIQATANDAGSDWSDWTSFWPTGSEPFDLAPGFTNGVIPGGNNAVAALPDGRLQLWVASTADTGEFGPVYSCWQLPNDSDAEWSPWIADWNINGRADLVTMTVARLTDNRLQLWGLDQEGNMLTTWKIGTDSNSNWTPWSYFELP
jgi:hypothetical protein